MLIEPPLKVPPLATILTLSKVPAKSKCPAEAPLCEFVVSPKTPVSTHKFEPNEVIVIAPLITELLVLGPLSGNPVVDVALDDPLVVPRLT
jgi:hypothetical protein